MRICALYLTEPRLPIGSDVYRVNMPFFYISQKKRHQADYAFITDIVQRADMLGPQVWDELAQAYDLFVLPRAFAPNDHMKGLIDSLIDLFHAAGKPVVYEVDDDFSNEYRQVLDGDAFGVVARCDAITVSVPALVERMKALGKPTYVLPNCVSAEVWKDPFRRTVLENELLIGLTGSTTHADDWRVLETVLPDILERYPQVHLLIGGFHPDYLAGLPRTEYVPPVRYERYSRLVKGCDIILAPLNDDPFNRCKSPIKVLEGMAAARTLADGTQAGAACIASNHDVYSAVIEHGFNGLLTAHTPHAWAEALETVITDTLLRKTLQRQGYRWVWKHRDIARRAQDWLDAYAIILKQDVALPLSSVHSP